MSERKAYPSDLTDAEWEILEPLIPAISEEAINVKYTRREIVNGILYVLRSGCPWRLVPHDLPAWGALYYYFRTWRKEGIWDRLQKSLLKQVRQKADRDEEPSAAVIDSQSIPHECRSRARKRLRHGKTHLGSQTTPARRYSRQSDGSQGYSGFSLRSSRQQKDA